MHVRHVHAHVVYSVTYTMYIHIICIYIYTKIYTNTYLLYHLKKDSKDMFINMQFQKPWVGWVSRQMQKKHLPASLQDLGAKKVTAFLVLSSCDKFKVSICRQSISAKDHSSRLKITIRRQENLDGKQNENIEIITSHIYKCPV